MEELGYREGLRRAVVVPVKRKVSILKFSELFCLLNHYFVCEIKICPVFQSRITDRDLQVHKIRA